MQNNYKEGYQIPFILTNGQNHRFNILPTEENYDFSGHWNAIFNYDTESPYPAQAQFTLDGQKLNGTFTTETGDYRFLQGNVQGDKLKLSVFDGSHAFLFTGQVSNDTIYGEFRSGKHYKAKWKAFKGNLKSMKDPYNMTRATTKYIDDFEFTSSDGSLVSLSDLEGRVKLINIMGTWCPNCKDEISFLNEVTSKFDEKAISIVSLAFERYKDQSVAMDRLRKYKETMGFDWPILLGGYANKKDNSEALTFIDQIYSYPTLLVLDQSNEIKYIHTGFYGPATKEFNQFRSDFLYKIDKLLIEN
ncbi:MAG: TlpA family protein disulfide reductase [Bacteroidia bacterium]|nr:TlpA family protein disulfide reductase [Bacteroidia bacterium]